MKAGCLWNIINPGKIDSLLSAPTTSSPWRRHIHDSQLIYQNAFSYTTPGTIMQSTHQEQYRTKRFSTYHPFSISLSSTNIHIFSSRNSTRHLATIKIHFQNSFPQKTHLTFMGLLPNWKQQNTLGRSWCGSRKVITIFRPNYPKGLGENLKTVDDTKP